MPAPPAGIGDLLLYHQPDWLPVYDPGRIAAEADRSCGFSSDMMAAQAVNGALFEEQLALLQLCAAFTPMLSAQRRYRALADAAPGALQRALAANAAQDCPTYSGLIGQLLREGVIGEIPGAPG